MQFRENKVNCGVIVAEWACICNKVNINTYTADLIGLIETPVFPKEWEKKAGVFHGCYDCGHRKSSKWCFKHDQEIKSFWDPKCEHKIKKSGLFNRKPSKRPPKKKSQKKGPRLDVFFS
jgi:hypothetical protein